MEPKMVDIAWVQDAEKRKKSIEIQWNQQNDAILRKALNPQFDASSLVGGMHTTCHQSWIVLDQVPPITNFHGIIQQAEAVFLQIHLTVSYPSCLRYVDTAIYVPVWRLKLNVYSCCQQKKHMIFTYYIWSQGERLGFEGSEKTMALP